MPDTFQVVDGGARDQNIGASAGWPVCLERDDSRHNITALTNGQSINGFVQKFASRCWKKKNNPRWMNWAAGKGAQKSLNREPRNI